MPAALTLILICPSPGSRSGTPAHFSTSGGPYPVITTALGIAVPFLPGRGLGMAANGNFSVFVVRPLLLHRSRLATGPALPGPPRGPDLRSLWRRADGRAGAAQQGQRAAGACGV